MLELAMDLSRVFSLTFWAIALCCARLTTGGAGTEACTGTPDGGGGVVYQLAEEVVRSASHRTCEATWTTKGTVMAILGGGDSRHTLPALAVTPSSLRAEACLQDVQYHLSCTDPGVVKLIDCHWAGEAGGGLDTPTVVFITLGIFFCLIVLGLIFLCVRRRYSPLGPHYFCILHKTTCKRAGDNDVTSA